MPPERPRPDLEQVRDALRQHDERTEQPEPPPPEDDERDADEEDDSTSG